ncbi:MAG: hypothetical protein JSS68_02255 [Actinobacteria bacterium]|nr:hypothetical protein [Actinomycetota bacterium]
MAAFGGNDSCPNCGARMAADQRYCLTCGHRRGDPRLPFMDAVVFMESMSSPRGAAGAPPPPPAEKKPSNRMNANAALIAGVATLVLAIGVGFLIGRSGHEGSNNAAAQAPIKVIEVGGGGSGGGSEASEATASEETGGGGKESSKGKGGKSGGKAAKNAKPSEVKEGSKQEEKIAAEKTAETLHAEGPLAKPTAKVGETCEKGTPGCEGEEFTGNFFGE